LIEIVSKVDTLGLIPFDLLLHNECFVSNHTSLFHVSILIIRT